MALSIEALLRAIREAGHPLGVREVMRAAGLHPGQQTAVKRALRELVRVGQLSKDGKRFFVRTERRQGPLGPREETSSKRSATPAITGILHLHRDGFGFVHPSGGGENIYLAPDQAQRALDNDRVVVRVVQSPGGRTSGRLLKVLERRRQFVLGTYRVRGRHAWVEPRDAELQGPIRVPPTQLARDRDLVKVRLDATPERLAHEEPLSGEVAGSLGHREDASVEVLGIAYAEGFQDEFPPEVMDEAAAVPLEVQVDEATAEGRRDLRALPLVTIDGEDARDFDDAIHVEDRPDGWRLVVAIADVSHYVQEGQALDTEALRRATSVYLPDRVLPMLPERLSNGICSLRPEEERLCLVADLLIDGKGVTRRTELYPAVMRSAARCTYTEVQRVLGGEDVPHRRAFLPHFRRALALSKALTQMRADRGAIDFDLPETKILLDSNGQPERMVRRERLESHRIVEECMLAANEAVARFFEERGLPCVYRFHAEPDEDKLAAFAVMAKAHGFHLPPSGKVSSRELNLLLEKMEGHPEQRALNQLLLRSMMQAVYSAEESGHFGLAAEHYLHFTSPIRRYPDLLVHRLLREHWERGRRTLSRQEVEHQTERLQELAVESSERERAAMQVEREVVAYYATLLMKDRLHEEFAATVAAITDFGFFVELDELFVEGLVKGESVEREFELDTQTHSLWFGSGRRVRIGQRARVRLVGVNTVRRQLDFEVVAFEGEPPLERDRSGAGQLQRRRKDPRQRVEAQAPARGGPAGKGRQSRATSSPGSRSERGSEKGRRSPERAEATPAESAHPGFDRLRETGRRPKQSGDRTHEKKHRRGTKTPRR